MSREEVIVGRHAVEQMMRTAPSRAVRLLLARGITATTARSLEALARAADVPVRRVHRQQLDRLAPGTSHQGVALVVAQWGYCDLEDLARQLDAAGDNALAVALDHITDPQNLGAIARAAAGAGAQGLIVPKNRSAPLSSAAVKASAGALATLPVARVTNLARALDELAAQGIGVVGASASGGKAPWEVDLGGAVVVVVGSEHKGLGRNILKRCREIVTIPLAPGVESLNVAAATAIILYERMRQQAGKA